MKAELGEGLRYVFTHPYQRGMVAAVALSNFFGNLVFSILLVYAVRGLGLSAGTIGIVFAIGNIGTLAAALTAQADQRPSRCGQDDRRSRAALFSPGTLLIAIAPEGPRDPVPDCERPGGRLRRHPLQCHRHQPDPGDHA